MNAYKKSQLTRGGTIRKHCPGLGQAMGGSNRNLLLVCPTPMKVFAYTKESLTCAFWWLIQINR